MRHNSLAQQRAANRSSTCRRRTSKCKAAAGRGGAQQQIAALADALPTSTTSPAALAALVEQTYNVLQPEAPAVRSAFAQVVLLASADGRRSTQRASPWGGVSGAAAGGRAAAAAGGFGRPTGGSSSPWGGFLSGVKSPAAAGGASAASPPAPTTSSAEANAEPPWAWDGVRQLHAYGLGSLSEFISSSSGSSSSTGVPKRASMRLAQWALVLLLQRHLLPGLQAPPHVSDPAFSEFDLEAARLLGWEAHCSDELLR